MGAVDPPTAKKFDFFQTRCKEYSACPEWFFLFYLLSAKKSRFFIDALPYCLWWSGVDCRWCCYWYWIFFYILGRGVWLGGITVLESSLATLPTGWLWAGLFFVFITLGGVPAVPQKCFGSANSDTIYTIYLSLPLCTKSWFKHFSRHFISP